MRSSTSQPALVRPRPRPRPFSAPNPAPFLPHAADEIGGRWGSVGANVPGVYAVGVTNRLPEDIIEELRDAGIAYRPRDGHK